MLVAMDLEALLQDLGCEVQAANSITSALDMLQTWAPDVATLDLNLNGESTAPVAAALRESRIPFVVVTGYTGEFRSDPASRNAPLLKKPYRDEDVVQALTDLLNE